MEEVEFDARDFARAVGSGGSAATGAFRQFRVLMEKHHESDGTSVDAAAAYLEYRPGADEVLQWIDVEHKSVCVAALRALIYLVNAKTVRYWCLIEEVVDSTRTSSLTCQ
mmetsp:Transcript_5913/g.24955  ORF Transcript_5913/g.24955 Transcript_5913/m.24955 type:complete len:110 (+) Transcript_5913:314-643(+)